MLKLFNNMHDDVLTSIENVCKQSKFFDYNNIITNNNIKYLIVIRMVVKDTQNKILWCI